MRRKLTGSRGDYAYSTLGSAPRRSSGRGGSPHVLPGPDAHPPVRAAWHDGTPRLRSPHPLVEGGQVGRPDLPVQPWVMDASLPALPLSPRPEIWRSSRPRSSTAQPPACPRSSPRMGTDESNSRVDHLLGGVHLGDRTDHHLARGADRRLRLLPRPRPRPAQGSHRPVRCRKRRQRPRLPAPRPPSVEPLPPARNTDRGPRSMDGPSSPGPFFYRHRSPVWADRTRPSRLRGLALCEALELHTSSATGEVTRCRFDTFTVLVFGGLPGRGIPPRRTTTWGSRGQAPPAKGVWRPFV